MGFSNKIIFKINLQIKVKTRETVTKSKIFQTGFFRLIIINSNGQKYKYQGKQHIFLKLNTGRQ
jgi:hypothetical protein